MTSSVDKELQAILSDALRKWDKCLVLISLPHTAALGAYIGRYDFSKDQAFFLNFPIFLFSLTAWIFLVDMRLRDEFLQESPNDITRFLALFRHIAFFAYPVMLYFAVDWFGIDADRSNLGPICQTLGSWLLCVLVASGVLHSKVMNKALTLR